MLVTESVLRVREEKGSSQDLGWMTGSVVITLPRRRNTGRRAAFEKRNDLHFRFAVSVVMRSL